MRNNLILIGIVILLGIAVWFYKFSDTDSTLSSEANFSVENIERVQKIFLADMEGNAVTLQRQKSYWIVNGRYRARKDAIKHLLKTIKNVEVMAPVPESSRNRVIKDLSSNHIKVELYDGSESLIKSFFVGGSTNSDKGTYMMLKGAEKPYVTHLPGFKGYLTPRFFTDSTEWRSRVVMDFEPKEIQRIEVDYPDHPKRSFAIHQVRKDSFTIRPLHRSPIQNKPVNQAAIKKYLTFFKNVGIETFINKHPKQDSITATIPFAKLTVVGKGGSQRQVKAYPMSRSRRSKKQFTEEGEPVKFDPDRMYGLVNNGQDFAIIQVCPRICTFGKIFLSYPQFFIQQPESRKQPLTSYSKSPSSRNKSKIAE